MVADPLPARQGSATEAVWVPAALVAELLGISRQAVGECANAGDWRTRLDGATGGGLRLDIALESLPEDVQLRALRALAPEGQSLSATEPQAPAGSEYERASATEKAEADRRLGLLTQWQTFAASASAGARIRSRLLVQFMGTLRAQGVLGVSKSSLYTWEAAYRARGLDGLVPCYGGGRTSTINDADRRLFTTVYGDRNLSFAQAVRTFLHMRQRDGVPGPAPSTPVLRYYVDHLTAEERLAIRGTDREVLSILMPYTERDYRTILPLAWFCMDHTPLDLLAVDPEGHLCRPFLTTLMDMRTRRLCVTVCRQPNQDTVLYTLAKAILAWGLPHHLYVDNGKDFRSKAVTGGRTKRVRLDIAEGRCRSLCSQLDITAHFAEPYNAQAKPIERVHRTIEEQFSTIFASYVGRSPAHKPEELKEELRAGHIPTFAQVERALVGWIESVYHESAHTGQAMDGRSPNQVWAELIGQVVVRTATREQVRFLMLRSELVTVRRSSVTLFGRRYQAAAGPDCLYGYHGQHVRALYDPQDITRLFLVLEDNTPVGYVIEKALAAHGPQGSDVIAAVKAHRRQIKQYQQKVLEDKVAQYSEPDPAIREIHRRERMATQPGVSGPVGHVQPATAPGRAKVVQIFPLDDATKAAAAMAATPPARPAPRDVAAEHHDAMDDILTAAQDEAPPPPAADEYNDFLNEVTG